MNVGLLLLRLMLAALLFGHGGQKLFGWFRGMGPARTGELFEKWGFAPGPAMAVTAGLCEVAGAGSMSLGLLSPLGCAAIIGTMLVAASPNAANGLWAHMGGCEVPVVYAGLGAVLALTGPGRFSLDDAFGWQSLHTYGWGVAAIALGIVASVPPLIRRRTALRPPAHNEVMA